MTSFAAKPAEVQKKWFGEAFPDLPVKWDPEF